MADSANNFEIIDGHLHVYDLKLKASFPNQNWTIVDFPDKEKESAIYMDITQEYAKEVANKSGVKKVIMVMCFDDCPEEAQWVRVYPDMCRIRDFYSTLAISIFMSNTILSIFCFYLMVKYHISDPNKF